VKDNMTDTIKEAKTYKNGLINKVINVKYNLNRWESKNSNLLRVEIQ
jgi:hypothetical protein